MFVHSNEVLYPRPKHRWGAFNARLDAGFRRRKPSDFCTMFGKPFYAMDRQELEKVAYILADSIIERDSHTIW
ncbi:hypothetical protein LCGC14_0343550 [marine sediment metagenome]|uniref:Uncharacterized protein n=1 Tax=marine sediment metagenome TaxID=412755 RepID=A0A0F9TW33_9ZZZZ